ncbi:hypothetical protein B0T26DRAFT_681060 [Lasiosphaeria miniovina]|uniref:Uncharacterized protein n=1 Tax=Lasiosphaeria miniovina TaxID=1954250 RepID=A0AA39ZTN8_9PEZI|nr:uncharacterized protein B0T26DRAFT_681060 [Lasiosphaeria miniovina]KAK0703376.1 hypothetical protein B0T26DRAFT_681060 [Lasiosphaeria miniovina]
MSYTGPRPRSALPHFCDYPTPNLENPEPTASLLDSRRPWTMAAVAVDSWGPEAKENPEAGKETRSKCKTNCALFARRPGELKQRLDATSEAPAISVSLPVGPGSLVNTEADAVGYLDKVFRHIGEKAGGRPEVTAESQKSAKRVKREGQQLVEIPVHGWGLARTSPRWRPRQQLRPSLSNDKGGRKAAHVGAHDATKTIYSWKSIRG